LAPSLDLSKRYLQVPYLLPDVLQVVIQLLLTIAEAYKTSRLAFHKKDLYTDEAGLPTQNFDLTND
jgi:hypothetical protein